MTDLLGLATELVATSSVSHHESGLADRVEADLRATSHLEVERVGNTVVGRSQLGRAMRVMMAGHLDTVPAIDGGRPHVVDDTLWGLGATDMKGGLAVMLDVATTVPAPAHDVTFVFYECEEVERRHNGLGRLAATRPDLLAADAAVLGEPTGGVVEAGCQGTLRVVVSVHGRRAHTARPWTGVNAVHRLGPVLDVVAGYRSRRVVLDGCEYAEQLQAVGITGGVAGNVVPDRAAVTVNFRFAPDRSPAQAQEEVRRLLGAVLEDGAGDSLEVADVAPGAPPALAHPLLEALVSATGAPPRAKVGWTDVALFAEIGVPAANFGPGDPLLSHTPDEHVSRHELTEARRVLGELVGG